MIHLSKTLFVMIAMIAGASRAQAQSFTNAYFLGDSLTDCCASGRFTQNNTPNYADLVPRLIGASYMPSLSANSAVGGAQSGFTNITPLVDSLRGQNTGLLSQVGRYISNNASFSSKDIAGIWIGTNDISAATAIQDDLFPGIPYSKPLGTRPSIENLALFVQHNVQTTVNTLASRGLRNVLLLTPVDLTQTYLASNPGDIAGGQLAGQYSSAIRNTLSKINTPGVNIYFLDTNKLLNQVQASPSLYGFTFASPANNCQKNNCSSLTLAQQERYVFNDTVHFTSGFQRVISDYAANIINARASFSAQGDIGQAVGQSFSSNLLNRLDASRDLNTPIVVSGTYTADLSSQPIALSATPVLVGSPISLFAEGAYVSIGRSARTAQTGPDTVRLDADFAGVTAGLQYQVSSNLLVGAAFSYLNTSVDLRGSSNARVDLDSYQGGVFASYNQREFFLDGAITYGFNNYDLSRPGIVDNLTATPGGNTLTVASKVGYLFDYDSFRVGPIAELTYATVRVGAYRERGDSVLTLSLREQSFDGLTGGTGIQLRTTLPFYVGQISPFVNLTAQYDFLDSVRTINSFSTGAPALLINTQAGRHGEDVYGKVSGGVALKFGRGLDGVVSGSATFGRSYGDNYLVSAGMRYRY